MALVTALLFCCLYFIIRAVFRRMRAKEAEAKMITNNFEVELKEPGSMTS